MTVYESTLSRNRPNQIHFKYIRNKFLYIKSVLGWQYIVSV